MFRMCCGQGQERLNPWKTKAIKRCEFEWSVFGTVQILRDGDTKTKVLIVCCSYGAQKEQLQASSAQHHRCFLQRCSFDLTEVRGDPPSDLIIRKIKGFVTKEKLLNALPSLAVVIHFPFSHSLACTVTDRNEFVCLK